MLTTLTHDDTKTRQYNALVDALWDGQCGEVEFTEVALDLGESLERIEQALNDLRDEDGVL